MKMSDDVDVDEIPLSKILVPLDGSEWSFRAAKYAIKIAKMANAHIVCVHAVVSLPTTAYANVHAGVLIPRYIEEAKKEAQKWYDEVRIIAEKSGVVRLSTETFLDVSSAADAIISYAEGNNIDLIILGTKGRTGLKKIVLGSVASGACQMSRPCCQIRIRHTSCRYWSLMTTQAIRHGAGSCTKDCKVG